MDKFAAAGNPPQGRERGRAAQYLRMSTDQQTYSLENQKDAIRSYADVMGYDVSRWGRFQNIDESASYEYRCQRAGIRIEFCAEQFANDGSIGSDVLKAI